MKTARAISVWTGSALFYWGGDSGSGGVVHNDGALYDPAADRWHRLNPAPIAARASAQAIWTGTEILVWGGRGDRSEPLADGAAFDPKTCRWRTLAASPLDARVPLAAVWTGREALFWGSTERPDAAADGAAYDPRTDRWRGLQDAPIRINAGQGVWTGEEMIVFGSRLDNNNHSDTRSAIGAAYDPSSDRWRKLPPVELSPQASAIAWTGHEMVAWDYELSTSAYVPSDDAWRDIADVPLDFGECYPANAVTSRHLFAYFCGTAAVLELATDRWHEIDAPMFYGRPVAAGSAFLFAGAAHETVRNRLMAYMPE